MMLKQFIQFIDNQKLFDKKQHVLLAVSGGMDSMVMVALFRMAKLNFAIAHCNFKLRGIESEGDADFVKKTANDLGVDYFEKVFDTRQFARQKKQSVQVAARELRYEWFNEIISKNNFEYFATAHHFDDQIETFFINLFRGTGVSGLRGILPKNGKCVRPLLFANRNEILQFATQNSIPYREDSTNSSDKYLRNNIRHLVIPALKTVNPDFRKGFQTTFSNIAATEKALSNLMAEKTTELVYHENDHIKIPLKNLKSLEPLAFYLFEILKPFRFNFSTIENICASLDEISGKIFFSPTHCLKGHSEFLKIDLLKKPVFENEEEFFINEFDTSLNYPVFLVLEKTKVDDSFTIKKDINLAQIDFDKLRFPLKLRKWKHGDTFNPLGMSGIKLISDYLIDEKIPLDEKHKIWLLVSNNEIVWLIGHRISEKFKITQKTKYALIIRPFNDF